MNLGKRKMKVCQYRDVIIFEILEAKAASKFLEMVNEFDIVLERPKTYEERLQKYEIGSLGKIIE